MPHRLPLLCTLTLLLGLTLSACAGHDAASTRGASTPAHARRVLIVITNVDRYATADRPTGYWVGEVAHPVDTFTRAGFLVDFASIRGGAVPVEPFSDPRNPKSPARNDTLSLTFLQDEKMQQRLASTARLADVDLEGYDALLFAGGTGAAFDFPSSPDVQNAARTVYEKGRVVAALCHGSAALVDVKLSDGSYLVKGKQVTGFTNKEEEMAGNINGLVPLSIQDVLGQRGGHFVAGAPWQPNALQDGRLITGQQPQSAAKLAELVVAALSH